MKGFDDGEMGSNSDGNWGPSGDGEDPRIPGHTLPCCGEDEAVMDPGQASGLPSSAGLIHPRPVAALLAGPASVHGSLEAARQSFHQ